MHKGDIKLYDTGFLKKEKDNSSIEELLYKNNIMTSYKLINMNDADIMKLFITLSDKNQYINFNNILGIRDLINYKYFGETFPYIIDFSDKIQETYIDIISNNVLTISTDKGPIPLYRLGFNESEIKNNIFRFLSFKVNMQDEIEEECIDDKIYNNKIKVYYKQYKIQRDKIR